MDAAAHFQWDNQDALGAACQVQDYGRNVPLPLRCKGVRRVPHLRAKPARQTCKPIPSGKFEQEAVPVARAAEALQGGMIKR